MLVLICLTPPPWAAFNTMSNFWVESPLSTNAKITWSVLAFSYLYSAIHA